VTDGTVGGPFNNLAGLARLADYPPALFPPGRDAYSAIFQLLLTRKSTKGGKMDIQEVEFNKLCAEVAKPAWAVPLIFIGDVGGTSARLGF
ncbi:uncharacterized protein TM35_000022600, partial [Trypanosoma theileri]